jgi:hypothetical protein
LLSYEATLRARLERADLPAQVEDAAPGALPDNHFVPARGELAWMLLRSWKHSPEALSQLSYRSRFGTGRDSNPQPARCVVDNRICSGPQQVCASRS